MAIYRQIQVDFWQDTFVLDLTPEEKYFYIYIMSNSKTSQCGIYEIPKKIFELETGYNRETVEKLLKRFVEYGKILYNDETKEIMILNWIKYNPISSINVKKCVEKELSKVKHIPFVLELVEICKKNGYKIESPYKPLANPLQGNTNPLGEEEEEEEEEEKEKEKEEVKNSKSENKFSDDSTEIILSKELFDLIKKNNEKAKEPNILSWAQHIGYLLRIDNRTPDEIRAVMKWSQQDSFWRSNILSTQKLRDKFNTLYLQSKNKPKEANCIGKAESNNAKDFKLDPRLFVNSSSEYV